jgi:hypothetical protein
MAAGFVMSTVAFGQDTTIPAKVGLVKPAKLAKFVSKPTGTFPLPSGPTDPSAVGADISFFDTSLGGGGSFTHPLPPLGWSALGNPAGSKGFKYKGKAVGDTTCSIVLIKPTVIKGVCKGTAVTLTTPFTGDDGIIIGIPAGSAQARYCAELGGTLKKNTATGLKRSDASAPGSCPTVPTPPPPTPTATPSCAISQGRYTEDTMAGALKVSSFQPFPFPPHAITIQDVSAPDANCVATTVIPYPGGLTVPVFCIPGLGYTAQVVQTGCGVGIIDGNGGSDLTTTEKGDTSFNGGTCNTTQSCAAFVDSSGEVTVTVGDGVVDTCSGSGVGNAMVSIPVETTTWLASDASCPDSDGMFNGTDVLVTRFPQTLDQTTDHATAQFADNDGDGCSLKGIGPAGPFTTNQLCRGFGNPYACCTGIGTGTCVGNGGVGACIDFGAGTMTSAGGGTVFSSAPPLDDLLFTSVQPANISGPTAFVASSCGSPPPINFAGTVQRCIVAP